MSDSAKIKNTFLGDKPIAYDGRCERCYMRREKCICDLIPSLDNKVGLTVLMHHRESYKTTNTARLAHLSLKKSEVVLRGLPHQPIQFDTLWGTDEEPVYLTLSDRSELLTDNLVSKLKNPRLIVPDGSWRQATRIGKREKALQDIRWIKLPPGAPSRYRLRHEHLEEGLATIEAIARAYGILESKEIQTSLETIFDTMVERTLETRPRDRSGNR